MTIYDSKFWLLQVQFNILNIFLNNEGATLQTASSWLSPFPPSAPLRRSCCETASPRPAHWPWAGENSDLLTPGPAQRTNTQEMWALLQSWRKSTGFLSIDGFILKARLIRSKGQVWGTRLIPLVPDRSHLGCWGAVLGGRPKRNSKRSSCLNKNSHRMVKS